ncbi:hypothetical protein [Streptomyces atratus]|uniref:hypothetical protein n=1 Tax=Streptomyces atratus TaxID=1893 RepID=UPI00224CE32A|nr:hypothetical protein [Streptomyces atratus]MCX5339148.1 hypothetical protein [Streptomyces atratus]
MVTHTLVFQFTGAMTEEDRARFFREGAALVLGSGLAESYRHWPHTPLSDEVGAAVAPVFVPSAMAQIKCADLDTMRKLFAYPPLMEFVQQWQARFPYKAVSVNTED